MYLEEISNIVRDKLDKRVVILDEFSLEPSWIKSHNLAILNSVLGRENIIVKRKYKESILHHFDAASVIISNYSPYIGRYYENREGYKAFLNRIHPFWFFESSEGREDVEFESNVLKEMPGFIIECVEVYDKYKEEKKDFLMDGNDKITITYNFKWKIWNDNLGKMVDSRDDFSVIAESYVWNMFMGNNIFIKEVDIEFSMWDPTTHRFKCEVGKIVIDIGVDDEKLKERVEKIINRETFKRNFELSRDGFEKLLNDNGKNDKLEVIKSRVNKSKTD